ncbi:hypothetical protein [Phenylobacterium soli]|uniref:Uncharacterized protein n=1 Tax=Phenylobacterium soli TaxID=2170551 RepID=A0A328ALY1_9CAUL|nr:hypothetical protein [Phenylobacterium soli]RAK55441.1 hypothetical protein DJ017_13425 [Phenylobacterium soli]
MPSVSVRKSRVPAEILNIGGTAAAILAVVMTGAGLSSMLPDPSPWLTAAAYLGPAGLAFAAYWWVAQKL